jgi:hypothetical protein
MPVKTVNDIPENVFVVLRSGFQAPVEFTLIGSDGDDRLVGYGALEIMPGGNAADGMPLWMAYNIEAEHGWGPFLMDVAMEWVTIRREKLYPHNNGIVPDAKKMWTKYYRDRQDVEWHLMQDDEIIALKVTHSEPELRCFYQKTPTTINMLIDRGQWINQLRVASS